MSTLSDQELVIAGLFIGAVLIVTLVVSLLYYVITALGLGRMFRKAGEPAWKAWIPGYNLYILYKRCWTAKMFWIWLVLDFAGMLVNKLRGDNLILSLIVIILGIASIVIMAKHCGRVARAYGRGAGTAVGLFFLPMIFDCILGFGKSVYTAPAEAKE
ncbi:MAG: DUF5684 domain-containing protein [bacterium]|nr:DUF5684 domain-containing protein [bacterium]MDY4100527.1 DUF5684 domain-containing protein [Lachnospiraceae bacterium]